VIAGSVGIAAALALMLLGLPVAYALALVGVAGFAAVLGVGPALAIFGQTAWDTVTSAQLVVLPLFLLMGNLIGLSGMSNELYRGADAFLGHRRGGLAMATVAACGAFSAVCGSSLATAATMARVALPSMGRFGYDPAFAAATVAAGGTLGILIPPSVALIVYGLLTRTSIGDLFLAGVVPGLIGIGGYILAIALVVRRRPDLGPPGRRASWRERIDAIRGTWAVAALLVFVIAGIYAGAFTATEAAGMGAFGALAIALARRSLSGGAFLRVVIETGRTTSAMFILLIGAMAFSHFLEVAGFSRGMGRMLAEAEIPAWAVIAAILAIYVVLGCFLESLSMTFLTVPIFFPIVVGYGFDPVWFGILVVVVTEIALITPPVGLNIFVIQSMAPDLRATALYRALAPFIAVDVARLALIALFPGIALLLPRLAS
jgi:C4-dicarboxylate transporter DctM subunit